MASAKSAAKVAADDPGGYKGPTAHPSKDVDNNVQNAPEGSRARENEEDVKRDVPASVDETKPGSGGSEEDKMPNCGLHQSSTGGDPKVEDDYKGSKEDPGTTHPANAEDVGEKYGSYDLASLLKMHKQANNELLAGISVLLNHETKTASPSTPKQIETPKPEVQKAAEAGYELAKELGLAKQAADSEAQQMFATFIKQAQTAADRVGPFVLAYIERRQKQAAEEENPKEDSGEAGGSDPAAELAAAAGGVPADMGGGAMPPPEAGGGDPTAAMGGGGEGGGPEQKLQEGLQEVAMAMQELGMDPEQFLQAAMANLQQQAGGGAGAGGDPASGGAMPPPDAGASAGGVMPPPDMAGGAGGGEDPAALAQKVASAVKDYKRSGRFKYTEAKQGSAQRKLRDEMKEHLRELVGWRN